MDALTVAKKPEGDQANNAKPAKMNPMQLDTVVLNLGKVTVKDNAKNPPSVQIFDVGVRNKTFHNIKSAQQLVTLVMIEQMKPAALKGAAIYGAAAVLGVAFLPAVVATELFHQIQQRMK